MRYDFIRLGVGGYYTLQYLVVGGTGTYWTRAWFKVLPGKGKEKELICARFARSVGRPECREIVFYHQFPYCGRTGYLLPILPGTT